MASDTCGTALHGSLEINDTHRPQVGPVLLGKGQRQDPVAVRVLNFENPRVALAHHGLGFRVQVSLPEAGPFQDATLTCDKPRPESGRDWLICSKFARQRWRSGIACRKGMM